MSIDTNWLDSIPVGWPHVRIAALRSLPAALPGKARLARALLKGIRSSEDVVVESLTGTKFVVPHLAEPVAFDLLVNGRYEPETEDFVFSRLCPGDVFIDAGANIGVFTMIASGKVGPQGRVLAVEASPLVFPYLERNLALNKIHNVTAARVALSDRNSDRVLFYAAPVNQFGMGSLAPQFSGEPCEVPTRTLDDLISEQQIRSVTILKLDVEGNELAVFQGARKLLCASTGPAIVFEFCDWAEERFPNAHVGQAQEFLMNLGYRISRLQDYGSSRAALTVPMTRGSAMLVAEPTRF